MLVVSAIALIVVIIFKICYNKKLEQKQQQIIENYKDWLKQNGFVCHRVTDDFLVDTANKKWCVYMEKNIFDISEIQNAEIQKSTSKRTTSNRTSKSNTYDYYFRNGKKRTGSINRVSNTVTSNSYKVFVSTNNVNFPVVTFDCGSSYEDAQKIVNTINIMQAELKSQEDK